MTKTTTTRLKRGDLLPITLPAQVIDHVATGDLMRRAREQAGLSLREMADRLKLTAPYLSDLERGRRNWTEDRVRRWADAVFPTINP